MWQQYTYRDSIGVRLYSVYTPDHYRIGVAVPLIVMLHGCSQTALDFAAGTLMNQVAERERQNPSRIEDFIVREAFDAEDADPGAPKAAGGAL